MRENDFLPGSYSEGKEEGQFTWKSPSNIALVKYWGKFEPQLPANPSVSFTLNNSFTTTILKFRKKESSGEDFDFELFFEGSKKEEFKPKILNFFKRVEEYLPFLKNYQFTIDTENTFPHSSGIASSASGMSALALCLISLERELNPKISDGYFFQKASFLARLGSGSACRSIEENIVVWGKHEKIKNSSDLYGIKYPLEVHPVFETYQDTILIVDEGEKKISSSLGHNLMHDHPFASARFEQAHKNINALIDTFASGDLEAFIEIVESEALTLHSLMMSSRPHFILMKPNTLEIINQIWEFRKTTEIPVCFTLDAGANVHVLYPEKDKAEVFEFIKNELIAYCEKGQYLCDKVGSGAEFVK